MMAEVKADKLYAILLVDDDEAVRTALRRTLSREPYEIIEAASGVEALAVIRARPIDIIISDHIMPQMTGIDFLRRARSLQPDSLRILLTGQADLNAAVRAINEDGLYRFLLKPWDHLDMCTMLRLATRHLDSERRNAQLLALMRLHAAFLERLHQRHPDLFTITRDERGAIVLEDDELAALSDPVETAPRRTTALPGDARFVRRGSC